MLLNNEFIINDIKEEMKNYLETNKIDPQQPKIHGIQGKHL